MTRETLKKKLTELIRDAQAVVLAPGSETVRDRLRAGRDAILTALTALGEGLREALSDAREALHRDRTGLAAALNAIRSEIRGREWLRPGFGWANYSECGDSLHPWLLEFLLGHTPTLTEEGEEG